MIWPPVSGSLFRADPTRIAGPEPGNQIRVTVTVEREAGLEDRRRLNSCRMWRSYVNVADDVLEAPIQQARGFMTALGIAYIELYVNEIESAVEYLASSFGFTPEAEAVADKENPNDSVLLTQGSIRLIVTAGPGTGKFLSSH
jgi:hypothetical protein